MMESLIYVDTIVILICTLVVTVVESGSLCLIEQCIVCNSTFALCSTRDVNEPIPRNLNTSIETLYIGYSGQPIELTAHMLASFPNLRDFSITGHITSLGSQVFASEKLSSVRVQYTFIHSVPDDTFGERSDITSLFLGYNKLRRIPTNVFHSLRSLALLDLSYNIHIPACLPGQASSEPSIGEEFRNLSKLDILHIAGLGSGIKLICKNITSKYFEPVSQIRQLNLSDTEFFFSSHAAELLLPLKNLTMLSLNHVFPFAECPAKAHKLFDNLSLNLRLLEARRWRTTKPVNKSCILTDQTLNGLKNLPNLKILDFKFSDQILGNVLQKSLFSGFSKLQNLELSWCRMTQIEDGALQGLNNLKTLNLQGNQIGSREFWVYGKNNTVSYPLYAIELQHCGIDSDETFTYNAYYLLRSFPNLNILDLSQNHMYILPLFTESAMPMLKSDIKDLDLSVNDITHLSGSEIIEMCAVMPNLTVLKANDNTIINITGLQTCHSLEQLHIMRNNLGKNSLAQKQNLDTISQLSNLNYLDLSHNGLQSIPPNLFHKMVNLTMLYLSDNLLVTFDNDMLNHNPHLSILDFSINKIQVFNTSLLHHNTALTQLSIANNLIEVLNHSFVTLVEDHLTRLSLIRVDGNPFDCTCGKLHFQDWVNTTRKLINARKIECDTPERFRYNPVYNYTESYYICRVKIPFEITGVIVAVIALSILLTVPSYRYRWYIRHAGVVLRAMSDMAKDLRCQDQCDYDVMISFNKFSDEDLSWVKNELLVKLEGGEYNAVNLDNPDNRVSDKHYSLYM